jgi:hypothetical protein
MPDNLSYLSGRAAEAYERVMGKAPEIQGNSMEIKVSPPKESALAMFEAHKARARKRYDDAVFPALGELERVKREAKEAYFRDIGEEI